MTACRHTHRHISAEGHQWCSACGAVLLKRKGKSLADTVKAWRSARGLSAVAASDLLGLPVRTLEGIEQGRPFRYEKMLRLALKAP